jgi:uncharacterized membrane protein
MKYADVERIHQAGLISQEQKLQIAAHFNLKEESSRFLAIVSFIGAILVASGIVLVIASNWDEIPRGIKIASGLALMLGAHMSGWYLREIKREYLKTGEALHAAGALLFLGNIALIGQIYSLSSRPPNAILLWWLGIAALPWLLRSVALHLVSLTAFITWFMLEINHEGSLAYFGGDESQTLLWALLALCLLGLGYWLRESRWREFGFSTIQVGIVGFLISIYPATWRHFFGHWHTSAVVSQWVAPVLAAVALATLALGLTRVKELTAQWRWTWGLCLMLAAGLLAWRVYTSLGEQRHFGYREVDYRAWLCTVAFFALSLVQIQVGVHERSRAMVNLGVAFIGLIILTAYINLFGSMARTGLVFILGGVFLIGLGVYLEKQRRLLMAKIKISKS